jgi:hypothetical protein
MTLYDFKDHPDHQARLGEWADKWIANAMSTAPADQTAMRSAMAGLYDAANLEPPTRGVFVKSPMTAAIAGSIAAGVWWIRDNPGQHAELFGHVVSEAELLAALRVACAVAMDRGMAMLRGEEPRLSWPPAATEDATRAATWAATWAATEDATRAATEDATRAATGDATWDATEAATEDATWAATRAATEDATRAATEDATRAATRAATGGDATWDATRAATEDATRAATEDRHQRTPPGPPPRTPPRTPPGPPPRTPPGPPPRPPPEDATWAATWAATEDATRAATEDATRAATEDATRAATEAATEDATRAATEAATWDATWDATVINFLLQCTSGWYRMHDGGSDWSSYPAYLSFFDRVANLNLAVHDKWRHYEDAATNGASRMMHKRFWIVSDRQVSIHVDPQARLHHETGPARTWGDGWAIYAWHGVRVPADLIEDGWDTARILKEPNAEVRRCAIERLGWERFVVDAGLAQVGENVPDPGNPGHTLALYDVPEAIYDTAVRVLICDNATPERDGTRRRFGLTVPASMPDPVAAAAWTFGLNPSEYAALERAS